MLCPLPDSFFRLGPEWVLRAVEAAGLRPTGHTTALTCLENRVHDVRLEDGSHVVVKFYRPGRWSREAILDEHRFLADLREAEVPVCAPLAFPDGSTLHEVEGIFYAIWPRTGGRSPAELSDDEVAILGRLLARIHGVGVARSAPHRPELTGESYGMEPLAYLEQHGFLPPACARRYRRAVEELVAIYEASSDGVPQHRIHGDCHFGNLLHGPAQGAGGDAWFFLDFDDFLVGPAVQDVWMLIPGRDADGARQRALLIAAYRQLRDFDERWLRLVEPLRGLRFVRYAAWIARRWEDPAFPSAFPHFGSQEYWERETLDLEELLAALARGEEPLPAGAERAKATDAARELTNEDFFWDL
jgi:Ser/Thr protein kinase RdoA (MazF antagonist)